MCLGARARGCVGVRPCVLGSLACVGAFVDDFECVVADHVCLCVTGQVVVLAVRVYDDLGVSVCECGAQLGCSR